MSKQKRISALKDVIKYFTTFFASNFPPYFPSLKPRCILWSEKYGVCVYIYTPMDTFIDFRERVGEREKESKQSVASQMHPEQGSNPQPFGVQDDAPTNSATQPGERDPILFSLYPLG